MIHFKFSIYDAKASAYLPPFILPRQEMATRVFADCCNSDDHQFAKHPADYTLFCLGTWDDETAIFTPEANGPQTLGNGVEFVNPSIPRKSNGALSNETPVQSGSAGSDTA